MCVKCFPAAPIVFHRLSNIISNTIVSKHSIERNGICLFSFNKDYFNGMSLNQVLDNVKTCQPCSWQTWKSTTTTFERLFVILQCAFQNCHQPTLAQYGNSFVDILQLWGNKCLHLEEVNNLDRAVEIHFQFHNRRSVFRYFLLVIHFS